jgi:hypothetical protein
MQSSCDSDAIDDHGIRIGSPNAYGATDGINLDDNDVKLRIKVKRYAERTSEQFFFLDEQDSDFDGRFTTVSSISGDRSLR